MQFPIDWSDERKVRSAFTWITRTGAGVRFGSRPVGWYQTHQCRALDEVERRARESLGFPTPHVVKVRLFHGMLQAMHLGPNATRVWRTVGSPADVYAVADSRS